MKRPASAAWRPVVLVSRWFRVWSLGFREPRRAPFFASLWEPSGFRPARSGRTKAKARRWVRCKGSGTQILLISIKFHNFCRPLKLDVL